VSADLEQLLGGPSQQILASLPADADLSALGYYNAVLYGLAPSGSAADNTAALQAAFTAALSAGGGKVFVPYTGGGYPLSGTVDPGAAPCGLIAVDGVLFSKQDGGTLFQLTSVGPNFGTVFEGFKVVFANAAGTVLNTASCQNIRMRRVYCGNGALLYADSGSLDVGCDECVAENDTQHSIAIVSLFGSQCYSRGGVYRQKPIASGGGRNNIGILIGSVSTAYLRDNHLSDFDSGLVVQDGAQDLFGNGLRIDAYTNAVIIEPQAGGTIHRLRLTDLIGRLTNLSSEVTPGCIVNPNGGSIDDVEFKGSGFSGFGTYGTEIDGGVNVKFVGGNSRGNGTAAIAVLGGSAKVIGHDCLGALEGASATQDYGLKVEGTANLFALGCDLSGNTTSPVLNGSSGTVTIVNCPPYD
jgi:hypothetical protein